MSVSLRRLRGVLRRFWLVHFRPGYVREMAGRLRGECTRCGDCCRILHRCMFLKEGAHCSIYSKRPAQCRSFPIDERDLADVPTCAFWFEPAGAPETAPVEAIEALEPEPVTVGSVEGD